jgi:hypothetical protein
MITTTIKVEYLSVKDLRENDMDFSGVVEWLLGSHIHFIINHVHQGLEKFRWPIEVMYKDLKRLKYHHGFPRMKQLECPIFTQDKIVYLQALPDDCVQRSFQIDICEDMDMDAIEAYVQR